MTMWNPHINKASGPLYLAIANSIEQDMKAGRLSPGTRMPTHRELADQLGVTVGTVTRGYAEAASRGLLHGETGRGTFVGSEPTASLIKISEAANPSIIDLGMTTPMTDLSHHLSRALADIANDPNVHQLLEYFPSAGRMADREAGVHWVQHYNLSASAENIALTTGGQNALATLFSALFRPGDTLAVEGITYPLVKTLARRFNLRLAAIDQDEQGMIPEALDETCRTQTIKGMYVMPTCQNPTTARMSDHRKQRLAAVAQQRSLMIIEDDAYGPISGEMGTPIAAIAPEHTFFIASISKSVAGGLRIAYLVSPPQHARSIRRAISDITWMTPPLTAEIAKRWILDGTVDKALKENRLRSAQRMKTVKNILSGLDISAQKAGYYGWLKLPAPWTAADFTRVAKENGISVTPDDVFVVGRRALPHAIRIAVSGPSSHDSLRCGLNGIKHILENIK